MSPIADRRAPLAGALLLALAACGGASDSAPARDDASTPPARRTGTEVEVRDTIVSATFDAVGTAHALLSSTLSTKMMATVTRVLVQEGDQVRAGQLLVQLDAREMAAKAASVAGSLQGAEAMQRDAAAQLARQRALWADSAATRVQLEAAETAHARAEAAVAAARAAAREVDAVTTYTAIRAPFTGVITRRFVDPGAFAAPSTPLVALQDVSSLRIAVSASPDVVRGLRRGRVVTATIEGTAVPATIEGVVPADAGNLHTVHALVRNADRALLAGSAATLALPRAPRTMLLVPTQALHREGDLVGVTLRTATGDETRWIRTGLMIDGSGTPRVEVTAGLRAGERIVVPPRTSVPPPAAGRVATPGS
ncbi:MAG: efflux RND transporter periplasmic adaptor subunit [Gemmatimonadaceae bacterium]|jgi:RND family efflux transporter MFP subunit|nr:efflux RND transporter periplasmic adaptor subunit [Gemmatimonadaceae bacterium]